MTSAHVLVRHQPTSAAVEADGDLGRAAAVGTQAFFRLSSVTIGQSGQLSQPAVNAAEPALEGLAHVEEEMPSTDDLERGRRTGARRSGVLGRAVAGDDLDAGMTA